MSHVVKAWNDMRIAYQVRYSVQGEAVFMLEQEPDKPVELATERGRFQEMEYVLQEVFGLTEEQCREVIRNGGVTEKDIENEQLCKEHSNG